MTKEEEFGIVHKSLQDCFVLLESKHQNKKFGTSVGPPKKNYI